ncbi:MAG: CYTH domain-containing protein [Bacteroidota bacterium]
MPKEIERKFLLEKLPGWINDFDQFSIQQAYLTASSEDREIRIRQKGKTYWLTIKSAGGLEREEYETAITETQFNDLWPARIGIAIVKDRYIGTLEGAKVEIDVYQKPLNGLMVAEVEFENITIAEAFVPFDWMGREVTQLNFLKNKNLLSFESYEDLKQHLNAIINS